MNVQELREIIDQYVSLDANDDFNTERCWKEMTEMLSEDVSDTIGFFERECTIEEFYWLSPIFENVAEKTKNSELISVWRSKLLNISYESFKREKFKSDFMWTSVTYEEYVRGIGREIDYAEGTIESD